MALKHADAQEVYAGWLELGSRIVFVASAASFLLYLSGVVPSSIPPDKLPDLWNLPVDEFLRRGDAPIGWHWIAFIGYSDYLNVLGIALFALLSLSCYVRVLPAFVRHGERLQAALALAQIVVLAAAASGLVG
ncbi:MAG TPA: hypothetical protein VIV54_16020 [Burkholderiales bacterium]